MGLTSFPERSDTQALAAEPTARHTAGAASADGRIWGTYIHGIFDNDDMRDCFFRWAAHENIVENTEFFSYRQFKEENYDMLARGVEEHIDVDGILGALGIRGNAAR